MSMGRMLWTLVLILGVACGSEGGPSGKRDVDGTGGSGGGGSGGDDPGGKFLALPGYEERPISVPLRGQVEVEIRLHRERAGNAGEIHLTLEGNLPEGVLFGGRELRIEEGEDSAFLSFGAGNDVKALDEPVRLTLRATGENLEEELSFELQVSAMVTTLEDTGSGSLRDVVESASKISENPTITFAPWIFTAEDAPHVIELESPIVVESSLTIAGPESEDEPLVILDGKGITRILQLGTEESILEGRVEKVKVFHLGFTDGYTDPMEPGGACILSLFELEVDSSHFRGCIAADEEHRSSAGGAILAFQSKLEIKKSRFFQNEASSAGAVAVAAAPLVVSESVFEKNVARQNFGGAIGVSRAKLEVRDGSKFIENRARAGGAIEIGSSSRGEIIDSEFAGNQAESAVGGAILLSDHGQLTIQGSQFRENEARGHGGAIMSGGSELVVEDSIFEGNQAKALEEMSEETDHCGGAIAGSESHLEIRGSLFRKNHAGRGGAIFIKGGTVRVESSSIVENTALGWAGGIDFDDARESLLLNSTIAKNEALLAGGVYVHFESEVSILFSTIVRNRATGIEDEDGSTTRPGPVGGIALANATLTMGATIVAENEATGDLTNDFWMEPDRGANVAEFTSLGYNLVGDVAGSAKLLSPTPLLRADRSDQSGDGEGDGALDPQLEALQEVKKRFWIALPQASSPVLDRVPATECREVTEVDQLETPRPVGDRCDIGAVERGE